MNYWILVVTQRRSDGRLFAPEEVLRRRMDDMFFGLGERTPDRRLLRKGDQIVFYLGSPLKTFAATAALASDSFRLTPEQTKKYAHGTKFYEVEYGVLLEKPQLSQRQQRIEDLLANLKFIENKQYWMAYLQGGIRQITEADFRLITGDLEPTRRDQVAPVVISTVNRSSRWRATSKSLLTRTGTGSISVSTSRSTKPTTRAEGSFQLAHGASISFAQIGRQET